MTPRASLVAVALLVPASAHADAVVTELGKDTPIAAYAGAVAWSSYDAASGRYRLERYGVSTIEDHRLQPAQDAPRLGPGD